MSLAWDQLQTKQDKPSKFGPVSFQTVPTGGRSGTSAAKANPLLESWDAWQAAKIQIADVFVFQGLA